MKSAENWHVTRAGHAGDSFQIGRATLFVGMKLGSEVGGIQLCSSNCGLVRPNEAPLQRLAVACALELETHRLHRVKPAQMVRLMKFNDGLKSSTWSPFNPQLLPPDRSRCQQKSAIAPDRAIQPIEISITSKALLQFQCLFQDQIEPRLSTKPCSHANFSPASFTLSCEVGV